MDKTIVFAGIKGGSGKTSTCMNTAINFLYSGEVKDLIVFDQDNQQQMTKFNDYRKEYGLELFKQFKSNDKKEITDFLKAKDGLKIVDTGGFDSDTARLAYVMADLIIIPLNSSDQEMDGLFDFKNNLEKAIELNPKLQIRILINRVNWNNTSTRNDYKELLESWANYGVFNTIVPRNTLYESMLFSGEAIQDMKPLKENVYAPIKNYVKEIKEILKDG